MSETKGIVDRRNQDASSRNDVTEDVQHDCATRDGEKQVFRLPHNDDVQGSGGSSDRGVDQSNKANQRSEKSTENESRTDFTTRRWPLIAAALIVAISIGAILFLIFRPKPDVWTDDAYIRVHYATVAPRVSGQVMLVSVDDDDYVVEGALLAQLDPRDYETAVAAAEAQLERDQAQSADVAANIDRQPALIDQAAAEIDAARARLGFAELDARRYENLAVTGAGTGQQRQQTGAALKASQAALRAAQAQFEANRRQLEVLRRQKSAFDATIKADQARLKQAQLNLSYTRILAPIDGMVAERSVQLGNVVSPGSTIMTLVPLQQVYVNANYREVELKHVRTGQIATIHVDAYNITLRGRVNAIPAASGAAFSPIPPNNATGNFTKIVQRLPVRIDIDPGQPLAKLLRVGFSVEATIHTGLEDVTGEQTRSVRGVTDR
ncbi:membrane fusion protein (multidrug efflux system) [Methylobacterium sp. OAE515]|uniref:efflux RND transporter periplasmic adaptor subunit n=1 Tax=Methylobacterium sp. OAE515 TaxID=2817895 RepID=UPI00178AC50B